MIAGLFSGFLWGLDTFLIGLALYGLGWQETALILAPLLSTALHDTCSALWLWGYAGLTHQIRGALAKLRTSPGRRVLLAAVLGGPIGMSSYVYAVQALGPGLTAVISGFLPAVGTLLAHLFLRQRIRKYQWISLCIGIGALILLAAPSDLTGTSLSPIGIGAALLCVISWGIETVLCASAMDTAQPNAVTEEEAILLRQTTSALLFLCVLLTNSYTPALLLDLIKRPTALFLLIAGAVGATSFLLYYRAIRKLGAGRGMALNSTYAAWSLLLAALFLQQIPTGGQLFASLVLLLSSLITAGACEEQIDRLIKRIAIQRSGRRH